jgi:hypothetical protein
MSDRINYNPNKISKRVIFYFVLMMFMLRPTNPALQTLFGSTLGQIINVFFKAGDYILIASVVLYAIAARCTRKKRILTAQAWLIYALIGVLIISTIKNGSRDSIRLYYEYLGNIVCIVYLYQNARTNQRHFCAFLKGISSFLTLIMLLNSFSIYIYYPNGMYILDDGVSGNSNYYLYALDNVGFIISLCSFAVSAVCNLILEKEIKRSTIFKYLFVLSAYFYCRAATAIFVAIMLLVALVLYRMNLLKSLNYRWALFICAISFIFIVSIQNFSIFDGIFALLGKNSLLGGRLRIWNAALNGWKDNFWLGIGIDANVTSTVLYQHGFVTSGWGNYIGHAHNIVFEFLLKSGLIGTVCFIGQLLLCDKNMMSNRKSRIAQFLCFMLLFFVITSLLDYRIDQIVGWILFMLLYDIKLLDDIARGVENER